MLGPPIFLWLAWLASGPRRAGPTSDSNDLRTAVGPLVEAAVNIEPHTSRREKLVERPTGG